MSVTHTHTYTHTHAHTNTRSNNHIHSISVSLVLSHTRAHALSCLLALLCAHTARSLLLTSSLAHTRTRARALGHSFPLLHTYTRFIIKKRVRRKNVHAHARAPCLSLFFFSISLPLPHTCMHLTKKSEWDKIRVLDGVHEKSNVKLQTNICIRKC